MRIKLDYFDKIEIPEKFSRYLWDYKEKAPLEILIFRILNYGSFEEIKVIFELYPDEIYKIAVKYHKIKRGVNFWIKMEKLYELAKKIQSFFKDFYRVSFLFFSFKNFLPLEKFEGIKKAIDYDIFLNKIYLYRIYTWNKDKVKRNFSLKFPNQYYKLYVGALLSFEDYGDLPAWIKKDPFKTSIGGLYDGNL